MVEACNRIGIEIDAGESKPLNVARIVVPRKSLTMITPRTARDYARCGEKTLTRDLNKLVEMDLVVLTPRGYQANRAMMLAFLPPRAESTVS